MGAPLVGVTPMYALCFFGYGVGQKIFCRENSFRDLELLRIGLAGAVSGAFTTPILAPGERAKCVLQTQSNAPGAQTFKGPVEVWKHLYKQVV
jgi:solute carrier family 25 carnitine/acylcarnitine transporter 20/29